MSDDARDIDQDVILRGGRTLPYRDAFPDQVYGLDNLRLRSDSQLITARWDGAGADQSASALIAAVPFDSRLVSVIYCPFECIEMMDSDPGPLDERTWELFSDTNDQDEIVETVFATITLTGDDEEVVACGSTGRYVLISVEEVEGELPRFAQGEVLKFRTVASATESSPADPGGLVLLLFVYERGETDV